MIAPIELEVIRSFVKESKQDRIIWELNSPRKRDSVIWKFVGPEIFKNNCLIPTVYMSAIQLEKHLAPMLTRKNVYYIGEGFIGELTLNQAARKAQEGVICIIYCGNGIGYYQGVLSIGRPPRYMLSSNG